MAGDLAEAIHAVRPDVCGKDVLAASPEASHFTALLESTLCLNCLDHGLDDADVIVALKAIYHNVYKHEDSPPATCFAKSMTRYVKEMLAQRFEGSVPPDLQEKIILRMMLSVKNIGGGPFGNRGYINYVKNNILSRVAEGKYVMEFGDGTRVYKDIPE